VRRCFFESNFPSDKISCSYGVLWNSFKRLTSGYSTSEKALLYYDNAARIYRLGDRRQNGAIHTVANGRGFARRFSRRRGWRA
jgi:hypothetical protein